MPGVVNLFYLSGNTTGGWVTFTAHLCYGLTETGVLCNLYKVGQRTEIDRPRSFGYGLTYRNVSVEDAERLVRRGPSLVVALQKNYRGRAEVLLQGGAWMVMHDPTDLVNLPMTSGERCLAVRRAVQRQVPGSQLLLHPYRRQYRPCTIASSEHRACSVSRIDFDKHTEVLLAANRMLPESLRVRIYGFENRIYTRFKVCPAFPEWRQSVSSYPRECHVAAQLCYRHSYSCDMSLIKGDGGGTQYTFLEAMDAGSVNVIQRGWVLDGDEMVPYPQPGANCVAVESAEELADMLQSPGMLAECRALALRANVLLTRHRAGRVAKELMFLLQRG